MTIGQLLFLILFIAFVLGCLGLLVATIISVIEFMTDVKGKKKLLTWKGRRKKVQGDFLIKQWNFEEFVIYELKFSWRFGYYWQKLDSETDQERAERILRRIIERKRRIAGLPRIYDFEGRLI